jgi:hypothetical protein
LETQLPKWAFWVGFMVLILLIRLVKFVLKREPAASVKPGADQNLARLTAAAERVLRNRASSAATSRGASRGQAQSGNRPAAPRQSIAAGASARAAAKLIQQADQASAARAARSVSERLLQATRPPAIIRRGGPLFGREPVIWRRN